MDNKRGKIRHLNNHYRMSNIWLTGTLEREKAEGGGDGEGGSVEDGNKSWNKSRKILQSLKKKQLAI